MFSQLARLGVTRAAAFFYAVAVGVMANFVIAHLSPHDDVSAPAATSPIVVKPASAPVATAVIAPAKPAEPIKPVEVSTPPTIPPLPPAQAMTAPPVSVPPPPPSVLPTSVGATLPTSESLAPPALKPAALPTTPPAPTPVTVDSKPTPDKPANNVETAASGSSSAPISLLPQPDLPADPPAPKNPGPGSGGLY